MTASADKTFTTYPNTPMARTNSRYLALETLQQLTTSQTPLPVIFQKICDRHNPSASDRALAMNLIYGVLRQQQYLEVLLKNLCRQPLKKLHPYVRQGLCVGLYQIFFLDRIPRSAAVNETVNAIKTAKVPKRLHGFVNGVLREAIRQLESLPQPDEMYSGSRPVLNHPEWMTQRWQNQFGREDMIECCRYNNSQQSLVLRVNSLKTTREKYLAQLAENGVAAVSGRFAADAVILPGYQGQVTKLPGYAEGLFHVQGEAAQLASLLLQPVTSRGRYLDGCAGLGGKTGHLLQLLSPAEAELVAVEPESHRQEKLLTSLEKDFSLDRFHFFRGSLQEFHSRSPGKFDGILIDAPCSGTGVTGKQPDIRWRRTIDDIRRYAGIQLELLRTAASMLLPGGVIVYATCSLEPEENIEVVSRFIKEVQGYSLTDPAPFLPQQAAGLIRQGCFQPRPSDQIDGFFAARLVRSSGDD